MIERPAMRRVGRRHALWAAPALLAVAVSAHAASCTVSSTGLAFGAYQPLSFGGKLQSLDRTGSADISMSCTGMLAASYSLSLGPGTYGSGNRIAPRYLANLSQPGDAMQFNLYTDPGFGSIWSDGITAGPPFTGTIPAGNSQRKHTAYGRIPAGQSTLKAGLYADTLTITLSFSP